MKCSLEISMYPLSASYEEPIIKFIKKLRSHPFVKVETNGMSTQVFGDYDHIMRAINQEMKATFLTNDKVVFTLKMANSYLQEKPTF